VLRVGVLLPASFESAGELLADLTALDGAGVDCLCVDGPGEGEWVVLGAAAAATHRARLAIVAAGEISPESLSTLQSLSRGRVIVFDRGEPSDRLTLRGAEPAELWTEMAMPAGRTAWNEALAAQEAAGAGGVIVPWDPRLLDLLRNPGDEDDRSDLLMSTG
jgi:hypothetical protein